jgi:hypothetical protein
MKIKLTGNRFARISLKYGNVKPKLVKPLPPAAEGKPFRSIEVEVAIWEDDDEMEYSPASIFRGASYCNPLDQFNKFEGRKVAMKRLMSLARQHLPKEDWQIICPIILSRPIKTK